MKSKEIKNFKSLSDLSQILLVSHITLFPTFQSARTHSPKQLYINSYQLGFATQLQMTSLSFPELRDFVRVWLYNLAHPPVHFLDQQRHLLSDFSNLPSSIFFKPFKVRAWVACSPNTRAIPQWLKVRKHS